MELAPPGEGWGVLAGCAGDLVWPNAVLYLTEKAKLWSGHVCECPVPARQWRSLSGGCRTSSPAPRGCDITEPLWTQCNLCIIGLIPFDSAFSHQKMMIQQLCLAGTAEWVPGAGTPCPAGGEGQWWVSCCLQFLLVPGRSSTSLPPFPQLQLISVNQSYRVELSQSQGKALAQIHQLKMSKAFEPDWNLSKTNKQTKILPQILVVFLFDFSKIVHSIFIYFPDFSLLFLRAWLYKCIPVQMYI